VFATRGDAHPLWGVLSALLALIGGFGLLVTGIVSSAFGVVAITATYLILDGIAMGLLARDQRQRGRAARWLTWSGVFGCVLGVVLTVIGPAYIGVVVGLDLIAAGCALLPFGRVTSGPRIEA
jgi:hypothetical protein